jgi:hypothetical protein
MANAKQLTGKWAVAPGTHATQTGTQPGITSTQQQPIPITQTTPSSLGTQPVYDATPERQPKPKWKDDRAQLNLKISWEKLERFKAWCHAKGLGQKEAVEMALDQLMGTQTTRDALSTQSFDFHKPGSSLDDVDLETVNIITQALFVEITGRQMNADDWQTLAEMRQHGGNAIACGIIAGGVRVRGKPINSFRYFERIIQEMVEAKRCGANLSYYKNELWGKWRKVASIIR